jgi:hypothetical protein
MMPNWDAKFIQSKLDNINAQDDQLAVFAGVIAVENNGKLTLKCKLLINQNAI